MDQRPPPPEAVLLRDALALPASAEVVIVSREPLGQGAVAGFEVHGAGTSEPSVTYFVDTSRRAVAAETGVATGPADAPDARVWLHPADPHLPALAPVAFSDAAATLLARLGLVLVDPPVLAAYRPGRRAVVRVETTTGTAWIKVVPRSRTERIVDIHRALAEHGIPVPVLRGWSDEGLLVLDPATGTPAPEVAWEPDALLYEVDRLREALAAVPLAHPARTGLDRRLDWYADRLEAVLDPARAVVAAGVVARARDEWGDPAEEATVHGDLHFGQLFLDDGVLTGVIDVDTAGWGAAADDAAAFLAHAIASAVLTPAPQSERVWALARSAAARWDGPGMRSRAATHLLGHALGAWEVGHEARGDALLEAAASVVDRPWNALGAGKSALTHSFETAYPASAH